MAVATMMNTVMGEHVQDMGQPRHASAYFLSLPHTCCCSYNWSGGRIVGIVIAAVCFAIACAILIYSCCLVRRRRRAYAAWHVSLSLMCCALRSSVSLSACFATQGSQGTAS